MNNFPNNMNTINTFPNAQYAPFGINDNNFNRRSMPSNIFPKDGGLTGNPLGRFNPLSTNTQQLMNSAPIMSDFQQAFEPNRPIIEKLDYINKNNLIHNNIGENVLDEHIVEYRLIIDSLDRDIKFYPNPFSFTVQLNPISTSVVRHEEYIDDKNKSKGKKTVETRFESEPPPHINKEFVNVKYVKLENIILPQFSKIRVKEECTKCHKDEFEADSHSSHTSHTSYHSSHYSSQSSGQSFSHYNNVHKDIFEFDPHHHLTADRFISMVIKELDGDRVFTTFDTNSRLDKHGGIYTPPTPFAIIIPDKLLGLNFYAGTPYYGSKIYKNSLLGNLTKLTVSFYDSTGTPLIFDDIFTFDDLEQYEFDNGEPLPRDDLRHPLNKRLQVFFSLIIGVVESQINTQTKFEA